MIPKTLKRAFTLVEMLLVIAIISILAGLVISNISNAAQDSRDVVARQQLAVVQEAVNHWVNHEIGKVTASNKPGASVAQVMAAYNATSTTGARYALFQNYLDESTQGSFEVDNGNARITSQAMRDVNKYLTLPNWGPSSYPKVQLEP